MKARVLLLCALASGCSLMNLDDFESSECDPDNPRTCDGANAHYAIDAGSACEIYACDKQSRSCVFGPRDADGDDSFDALTCKGTLADDALDCNEENSAQAGGLDETCDGVDNNCDGPIDEGDLPPPPDDEPAKPVDLGDAPRFVASASHNGTLHAQTFVVVGGGGGAGKDVRGFVFEGDETRTTKAAVHYRSVHAGTIDAPDTENQCPLPDGGTKVCSIDEVALAAYTGHLVYATVDRTSCPAGRVRLGVSTSAAPFEILLGKPIVTSDDESHLEFGVIGTRCDVERDAERLHVTAPAIAVYEPSARADDDPKPVGTDEPSVEALALWLGVPRADAAPACGARTPRQVAALRVLVHSAEEDHWLAAAHLGKPVTLDPPTVDSVAPSIAAWNDPERGGYFAAYAVEDGVLVGFLPTRSVDVDVPPAFDRAQVLIEDAGAEHVALSLGRDTDAGVTLRVAWRSGCDGDGALESAELAFDAKAETFSTPTLDRIADTTPTRGPVLRYAPGGFHTDAPRGGWVVLWVEGDGRDARMRAARIRETEHRPLGSFQLTTGEVDLPFLYPADNANVRFGVVRSGTDLALGRVTCNQ